MDWIWTMGLGGACAFLLYRTYRIKLKVSQIESAAKARQMLLVEESHPALLKLGLESLQRAVNVLIEDNRRQIVSEQGHVEQIRATLGNIREAVLIVDEENFVRLANDAFAQLLNRNIPSIGRRLESLVQGAEFFEQIRAVKQSGSGEHREVKVMIEKRQRWLEVTGTRLPEQNQEEGILTLFVLHDITELKNLERMRTDFVANVSHELRTPVTIIKGYVDTLIDDGKQLTEEEHQRFTLKIQRNVSRLHQLLEELLMLSRLESSIESIRLEPASLGALLNEAADNFSLRLSKLGKTIEINLEAQQDVLPLDRLRITQVLENLLENVLQHAKGFTQIGLRTENLDGGVVCWVEDDGQGIPAKELPHIFERFYRVDKSRSRESGGTGLGLSIVKHIIQQHGGRMLAESTPTKRTRIGFWLPLARN